MANIYSGKYRMSRGKQFELNYSEYSDSPTREVIKFNNLPDSDSNINSFTIEHYILSHNVYYGNVGYKVAYLGVGGNATTDKTKINCTVSSTVPNTYSKDITFDISGDITGIIENRFYNILSNAEYVSQLESNIIDLEVTFSTVGYDTDPNAYIEIAIYKDENVYMNYGEYQVGTLLHITDNGNYIIKSRSKTTHQEFQVIDFPVFWATSDTVLTEGIDENGRYILATGQSTTNVSKITFTTNSGFDFTNTYRVSNNVQSKYYVTSNNPLIVRAKMKIQGNNTSLIHSTYSNTLLMSMITVKCGISFNKFTGVLKANVPQYYAKEYILVKDEVEYARNNTGIFQLRESGTYQIQCVSQYLITIKDSDNITVVAALDAPDLDIIYGEPNQLGWVDDPNASGYEIYKDGKLYKTINTSNVQTYALRRTVQKIMFEVIE